jgi:hypothetical protein
MVDVQGSKRLSYFHLKVYVFYVWLGTWRLHFDDESWRGGGYAFLLSRTSVVKLLFLISNTNC